MVQSPSIFKANQLPVELVGIRSLETLRGRCSFDGEDPKKCFRQKSQWSSVQEDGLDVISIKLPFSMKEDVEPIRCRTVCWWRSGMPQWILPCPSLSRGAMQGRVQEGHLLVKFKESDNPGRKT